MLQLSGDHSSFSEYGSFRGLAENVDVGSAVLTDNALVFSSQFVGAFAGPDGLIDQLSQTVAHEAGHLLGYAHSTLPDHSVQSPILFEVASAEVTVLGQGMLIDDNDTSPSTADGDVVPSIVEG